MGAAGSVLPATEEDALKMGYTQEQIDQYKAQIRSDKQKESISTVENMPADATTSATTTPAMGLMARYDQTVFKVVLSHLDNMLLLESVQLVSRDFYDAIPGMIEGLDPLAMAQLKELSPLLKRNKKSDEMLNMFLNLAARCTNLRFVNFRNQTHLCGAKISRALARCSARLEALNLSQCIALTR